MARENDPNARGTEGSPWQNAEADAERLAETFAFTESQAQALVYGAFYGFPKEEVIRRMDTSESSYDNIYYKARNKAFDILDVAEEVQGIRDTPITPELGGEVGRFIEKSDGLFFDCMGCEDVHRIDAENSWEGRLQEDGLTDAKGREWWIHVPCTGEANYSNSWSTVHANAIGPGAEYHAVLAERRDEDEHVLALEVYEGPLKETLLADSRFLIAPTDLDDPKLYEVVKGAEGWKGDHQSISEWEFEGTSVRSAEDSEGLFHFETPFEAARPADHEREMSLSVFFHADQNVFEFEVADPFNVWLNKRFTLNDLGLERYEVELEDDG